MSCLLLFYIAHEDIIIHYCYSLLLFIIIIHFLLFIIHNNCYNLKLFKFLPYLPC